MRTLAKIKGGDSQYFGHLVSPADVAAYSNGTLISTSMSEPTPTINHLSAIIVSDETIQVSVVDGTLSSVGLGVQPVQGDTPYASPVNPPPFEAWMDDLSSLAVSLTAVFDPAMDVKYALLGEPSNAERLRAELASWLAIELLNDDNLGTYVLHGMFGQFGALPIVVVVYENGYLLLDAVDGTMVGPFHHEDKIDLLTLFTLRSEYSVGTSVAGVNMSSSTMQVAVVRKHPAPPPGYGADPACTPWGCWTPRTPSTPTGTPFYNCQVSITQKCVCKANGTYVPNPGQPPGPPVPTEIVCTYPAGPGGSCNANGTPPGLIPAPASCKQTWTYAR